MMDSNKLITALKDLFRPEFLNRVDEIITFNSLTRDELVQIVDLLLAKTCEALSSKEITLDVSYEAKQYLADKGTDLKYGARPLRRAIQKHIEDELAEMVLRGQITSSQIVYVYLEDGILKFDVKPRFQ